MQKKKLPARLVSTFSLVFLLLITSLSGIMAAPPTGFQTDTPIVGLNEPTAIEFLPDGRMLVIERAGVIRVAHPNSGGYTLNSTPFLTLTNINTADGESGLTGITLDPNFETNGYFYIFYTQDSPFRDRVSRFTATGDTASDEELIWIDNAEAPTWHHGGSVLYGPDDKLYISIGDGAIRANEVQLLTSNRGKILRVNPVPPTVTIPIADNIPTDNPFYDGAGPNQDEIYALGLRNPFRLSLDEPTGRVYIGDVGGNDQNNSYEEINILVGGRNYGYPICEGPERNPSGGACTPPSSPGTYQAPFFSYPHVNRDASVTGGFVYRGGNFPAEYEGDYFYGDYVQNWVRGLDLNPSTGAFNGAFNFEPANGTSDGPYGEIVDLEQGPDGAIYYVDIGISWEQQQNPGSIRRIRYTEANQAPIITSVNATPTTGSAPLLVDFTVSATDQENNDLTYAWDFGDGGSSTQQNPSHTYNASGSYTTRVTVFDGTSPTISDPITITVGAPPVIDSLVVSSPSDQPGGEITFRAGDQIQFNATASDPDGMLSNENYEWLVRMIHLSHTHPEAGPINNTSGTFDIPSEGHEISSEIHFQIILTVTDNDGISTSQMVEVFPETVDLQFQTVPSGLTININGINYTTPATINTVVDYEHNVVAPLQQTLSGNNYDFVSWSDNGASTHQVVTPEEGGSYTATYELTSTQPTNYALDFDGSNDLAVGPQIPGTTGTQTIEAWIKPQTSSQSAVFLSHTDDTNGWSFELASGQVTLWTDNNGAWNSVRGTTNLQANTWYHVVATYSSGTGTIFVNGTQEAQANVGVIRLGDGIRVGGLPGYPYFNGDIDEVRISNSVRYSGNYTVPTAPFEIDANTLALYHFNENEGQTSSDVSTNGYDLSLGTTSNADSADPVWKISDSPLTPPNGSPVALMDMASTDEDNPVVVAVLTNDSDPEENLLTVVNVTQAANGLVVINPNDTVTYTPQSNFNGADSFTYTISDGNSTDSASVLIAVVGVNDEPNAADDGVTLEENSSININVLSNDSDPDNDDLEVVSASQGSNGTTVVNLDNTVSYTPEADYIGNDSFTYTISDGNGGSDSATVNVTVTEVNEFPLAVDDSVVTNEDQQINIVVLTNDSDPDNDPLDVTAVTNPSSGSATINPDDSITYTPALNFNGEVSFDYTISDGRGGSDTGLVTVTITPVNDAPVANAQSLQTVENSQLTITLTGSDIDSGALTYAVVGQPTNGVLSGSAPNLTYTPNSNFTGNDSFTFRANDGQIDSNVAIVTITVTPLVTGSSLAFDGNDYARFVNIPLSATFTYEAWVKRTTDTGTYETIFSDATSNYGQSMVTLYVDGGSGDCGSGDQFAYYQKQGGSTQCSGISAQLNQWYHIAVSRASNGTRRIFINGTLVGTQNSTPAPTNSNGFLTLGRAGDYNGEYFVGLIDEVRISNSVRYTTNFTPGTVPFSTDANTVALYHLDEGTGQSLQDSSGNNRHGVRGSSSSVEATVDPAWSTDSPL